jgi:hypothetical protein
MASFVHEINSLLGSAIALEGVMLNLRNDPSIPPSFRKKLAELHHALGDLRRSIERQASYLTDIVTPDSRRRRTRQVLAERFETMKASKASLSSFIFAIFRQENP